MNWWVLTKKAFQPIIERMKYVIWGIFGVIITLSGCVSANRKTMEYTITNIAMIDNEHTYRQSAYKHIALPTEHSVYKLPTTVRVAKAAGIFVDIPVVWKDTHNTVVTKIDSSFIGLQSTLKGTLVLKEPLRNPQKLTPILHLSVQKEMRATWISYLDYALLLQKKTIAEAQKNIRHSFDTIRDLNLNTVIVHVRPFGDAIYPSQFFPTSAYVTKNGIQGTVLEWDPLAFMVAEAHKRNLEIHAWINPYRVSTTSANEKTLHPSNPARKWIEEGSQAAIAFNGRISYNPASQSAMDLISLGVAEVVSNYDIDGVHFDDYFYPTTAETFDVAQYEAYLSNGGRESLAQWRRDNVSALMKKVYETVHAIKDIPFGISPQGNNTNNLNTQYADTTRWLSENGYLDYITPQIYFGFKNNTRAFESTIAEFERYITAPHIDLYIGISAYKVGLFDRWAQSKMQAWTEWMTDSLILSRMIKSTRTSKITGGGQGSSGFMLYGFKEMFLGHTESPAKMSAELSAVQALLTEKPDVSFSLDGPFKNMLIGSDTTMQYSLRNQSKWKTCSVNMNLSHDMVRIKKAGGIQVRFTSSPTRLTEINLIPADTVHMAIDNTGQYITISQYTATAIIPPHIVYSTDGKNWISVNGNEKELQAKKQSIYYFKVKEHGIFLESDVTWLEI